MIKKYSHRQVESKWQTQWLGDGLYTPSIKNAKNKFYNLWMFPYPSGEGLHAGHAFASTGSDIYGRFKRMNGYDVFQPIGYDSFGIHSENFAIKIGQHPQEMLGRTTKNYERQMKSLGHGYDWTRTVTTSDVEYYRWTQWLFVQMFKSGLAYKKKAAVNWCPSCKTVLADEQVIEGKCERCNSEVEKRQLEQWFFRITKYADRLLSNLAHIDWSEKIKVAQRNWIGKKEGVSISYEIEGRKEKIVCWTSRPETNYGATFIVISKNHPLVSKLVTKENKETVSRHIKEIHSENEKSGVFTGSYAVNQLNNERLPIWISNYVVEGVGTGAIVGVPGHDKRDFEFAHKFGIKIVRVVASTPEDTMPIENIDQVQEEAGKMVNSEFLNGMNVEKATEAMMDYLEEKGWGERQSHYHLRDWLISRQRYWGPPIPMIFCEACSKNKQGYLKGEQGWNSDGWYPEENLPVELPYLEDYKPKGGNASPLSDHPEFYSVSCPVCGGQAKRETDVSDTFLDSAWYFLRYPSVSEKDSDIPWDQKVIKKWLPVDLYFGGAEHAVLHLMYARFVCMVLYDLKYFDWEEPFGKFFAHGLMIKDGAKMSKSRGNVVNPDVYIERFGADSMRLYLMFMGPMDGAPDFRDTGIEGMERFVGRVWKLLTSNSPDSSNPKSDEKILSKMHQTIKKVTKDIENFHYNTAISAIMEYANELSNTTSSKEVWNEALEALILLLAPFAPHLAEEVWRNIWKRESSIHISPWPKWNEKFLSEDSVVIVIQVRGKVRDQINIPSLNATNEEFVSRLALSSPQVQKWIEGKKIHKVIFVAGKLINFVV